MKKITLLIALVAFVFIGFSQRSNMIEMKAQSELSEVQHYTASEYNKLQSGERWGDVIWSEDFSGGQIPGAWTVVDNNAMSYVWYWSDDAVPGQAGTYSGNNQVFGATTAANGYIMISGDIYNAGGNAVAMDSYFITDAINCDSATTVMVKFEQYFRNCCSASTALNMSVSTDNVTWTDFSVLNGVATNAASDNPDVVTINVTNIAAGQSTVYLKFHQSLNSHYFWAVDDISLITAPINEIKLEKTYNNFLGTYGAEYGRSGYYSLIPSNQYMPLFLGGDIKNKGVVEQHNVTLLGKVLDDTGAEVFSGTEDTSSLVVDSLVLLEIGTFFEPTTTGDFSITWECYQDEVDEIPENNFGDTVDFSITDNKVYARDIMRTGTVTPDNYIDGADGDLVGTDYYIFESDTAESISVYIFNSSIVNTVLIGKLFYWDGTDNVEVLTSEEYVISASDIGTWIEIPFIVAAQGDNVLIAESNYIAGVELYWGTDGLLIGSDDSEPHVFNLESSLRIGADWYWISEVPMVRLNFAGAIVPPDFTSDPVIELPENVAYNYEGTVVSTGQTITITAITTDAGLTMDFVDNGGGSFTITTPVIETLGYASGDDFRIVVTADNSTLTNHQDYWVDVIDAISVDEINAIPVSIYPNPAQDELFVNNAENADIFIYNIVGEIVRTINNSDSNTRIDIANLPVGTYIISVVTENNVYTQKFSHVK